MTGVQSAERAPGSVPLRAGEQGQAWDSSGLWGHLGHQAGWLGGDPPHFLQEGAEQQPVTPGLLTGQEPAHHPPLRPQPHRLPQRKSRLCTAGTVELAFWPVTR